MTKSKKRTREDSTDSCSASLSWSKKPKCEVSAEQIASTFEAFSQHLAQLLSPSVTQDALSEALGEEKANFLLALGAMKKSGDFPWLPSSAPFPPPSRPPIPYSSTPPSSSWPPLLPEVRNPQLRQQAFTHRSWILGEAASAPGVENMHYERLEFLGDAYLQSISSHLLYDRFPSGREGLLSEMRQGIVANKALINYAQVYDMPKLLREGKGQGNAKMNGSKTIADCFEAYIGAVILDADTWDHGVKKVKDWLTALFEPKLREMEESRKNMVPVDKMAKNKLNAIAGGNRASIDYKWTDGGGGNKGGFWITVYLTGWGFNERMLGKGWGSSKSDAQLRAAMNVLSDKAFCQEMRVVRERILGPKPPRVEKEKLRVTNISPAS